MANRPLPNVDPEALSKLASQYPGSGQGRTEPKLGGSGAGGGEPDAGGDGPTSTSKAPAGAERPVASSEAVQSTDTAKAGGGRTTTVLTLVFALVALAAAVGALAAPSLRSEARALLQRHVPQLDPQTVDFITGHDTQRLEVTYEGLDQRVARLTEALERITAAPGIDPQTARDLLLRTEQNQRLEAAEAAVVAQGGTVMEIAGRIDTAEQRLAALDDVRQSLDGLSARADAAEQSVAGLREAVDALEPRLAAITQGSDHAAGAVTELSERLDASVAEMGARADVLSDEVARAHAGLAPVADLANRVALERVAMELPLIGMTQLRLALDRDRPFRMELALAGRLVGGDAEAQAALTRLETHAESGVTTLPGLRRDFGFVATQMGGSLNRMQNWTQRMSSWLEVLVGARTMPEADPMGEITAAVASIDAALEAGQLDLAIDEAVALNGRRSDVLLEGWIVEAQRRLSAERAFSSLTERIYARIGNAG